MAKKKPTIPLEEARKLVPDLRALTVEQFAWVKRLVRSMALPTNLNRSPSSDLFPDDRSAGLMFLYLITHHALSAESFKKEKCEYALEQIMKTLGRKAERAKSRTNPGHDLTVDGERWSLKSEAHRAIKRQFIHFSKWMELGKGKWEDESDLRAQCARFQAHLAHYDRIFSFRCLTPEDETNHCYELLEIPKSILLSAGSDGEFTMMHDSTQDTKPGYCKMSDENGLMYELYFDAGTERKLRVQKLRRDLCTFHAEWKFATPVPPPAADSTNPVTP